MHISPNDPLSSEESGVSGGDVEVGAWPPRVRGSYFLCLIDSRDQASKTDIHSRREEGSNDECL